MIYNIDNIVKMNVQDSIKDPSYSYVPEKKTWYGKTIPEYWVNEWFDFTGTMYTRDKIEQMYTRYLDGNIVYLKSCVRVWYNDGSNVLHCFETYEGAKKFSSDIVAQIPRSYEK